MFLFLVAHSRPRTCPLWSPAGRGLHRGGRLNAEHTRDGRQRGADPSSGPRLGLRTARPLRGVMRHLGEGAQGLAQPGHSRNARYPHRRDALAQAPCWREDAPGAREEAGGEQSPRLVFQTRGCRSCRGIMGLKLGVRRRGGGFAPRDQCFAPRRHQEGVLILLGKGRIIFGPGKLAGERAPAPAVPLERDRISQPTRSGT